MSRLSHRPEAITEGELHFMRTGDLSQMSAEDPWKEFDWAFEISDERASAWAEARARVVADWIRAHPGTRPWAWWDSDAPQWRREDQPDRVRCITYREFPEPRMRLRGVGTPVYEVLNIGPSFEFGIPSQWVSPRDEAYYNGRAHDIQGNPIGTEYAEGHFAGLAPRPDDPPVFESQAAYLKRHGLFVPGEEKRLSAADFEPEILAITFGDAS